HLQAARFLALPPFEDVRNGRNLRVEPKGRRPRTDRRRVRNAVPLIETLIGRIAAVAVAEVPLAEVPGGVAALGEQLGGGGLPLRQAVRRPAARDTHRTGTKREAPGEQRGAARRALIFHVIVEQAQPFGGQAVDARSRRAAQDAAAVTTRLAVA